MHICGNTTPILEELGKLGCEIVDLDHMVPMTEARAKMGPGQVLLGNIDPVSVLLNGTREAVTEGIAACHQACAPRYIVGAGCEVPRGTPRENVLALAAYARTASLTR